MIILKSLKYQYSSQIINAEYENGSIIKIESSKNNLVKYFIYSLLALYPYYKGEITYVNSGHSKNKIENNDSVKDYFANLLGILSENGLLNSYTIAENLASFSQINYDLTYAAAKVFNLFSSLKEYPYALTKEKQRLAALSRLLINPQRIWVIENIDSTAHGDALTDKSLEIIKHIVKQRAAQQGIILFSGQTDFMRDLTTAIINLD